MLTVLRWLRCVAYALLLLAASAWLLLEGSQWLLRWQGEYLLADVRKLEVGRTRDKDADALMRAWGRWGFVEKDCHGDDCSQLVTIWHGFPMQFNPHTDEDTSNLRLRILDNLGLRTSKIGVWIHTKNGIVIGADFGEIVAVPVKDMHSRGGAYVPDLSVTSGEKSELRDIERAYTKPSHPFSMARHLKGPWGLAVSFLPDETASQKPALMDFRFSCITQFVPCTTEAEILPEGWRLLQADQ